MYRANVPVRKQYKWCSCKASSKYRLSGRWGTQWEQTARCMWFRYAQYATADACQYLRSPRYPRVAFRCRACLRVTVKNRKHHARSDVISTGQTQGERDIHLPTWMMWEPGPSERVTQQTIDRHWSSDSVLWTPGTTHSPSR